MSRTKLKNRRPARITGYPEPYREALACFEAMRRFGFEAEEIFFGFDTVDGLPDIVHIQLQTQGKTFTVICGKLPGAKRSRVRKTWLEMSSRLATEPQAHMDQLWRESSLGREPLRFAQLAAAIALKGIVVPELPELAKAQAIGQA